MELRDGDRRSIGRSDSMSDLTASIASFTAVLARCAMPGESIERLMTVTRSEIDQRMREMRRLVAFEEELPA